MSSELREELTPYIGEVLHRQKEYDEIKNLVQTLSDTKVEAYLNDNSSRSQGYSEEWSEVKELEISKSDYIGYKLQLKPASRDQLEFRTTTMVVKEEKNAVNLIFPSEEVIGQRLMIKI
ncbi:MAG: hypothetical protein ACQEQI_07935 [Bacillota bacterium]